MSLFRGGNDGQKAMGLIMLILIGTVPTACALARTMHESEIAHLVQVSQQAHTALTRYASNQTPDDACHCAGRCAQARRHRRGHRGLAAVSHSIDKSVAEDHSMANVPPGQRINIRSDMYVVGEGLRYLGKTTAVSVSPEDKKIFGDYKKELDHPTKFIPTW